MSKNEKLKKLNDNNVKKVSGGAARLVIQEEDGSLRPVCNSAEETTKFLRSVQGTAVVINKNKDVYTVSDVMRGLTVGTASSKEEALDMASKHIKSNPDLCLEKN